MAEIEIKLDVPAELKTVFELALAKALKQLAREVRFAMLDDIMSESELTEEQIKELSDGLKKRVAKRHGL